MKILPILDRYVGRIANLSAVILLVPASIFSFILGYFSSFVEKFNGLGVFGFILIGLIAFFLISFSFAFLGFFLEKWSNSRAINKWSKDISNVNPMQKRFSDQRLLIGNLAHPVTNRIIGKVFDGCDIIGPDNIVFIGKGLINDVGFHDCDFIIVKDGALVKNVKIIEDCSIINTHIWNCVVFMSQEMWDASFSGIRNIELITYKKNEG